MLDILYTKMAKRKIDLKALELGKLEIHGKGSRQQLTVLEGVEKEMAKKIVKIIKVAKLKVQAAIQGEKVRVTGKKRDDLQEVIALLKESKLDIPLQFINYRD